MATIRTRAVRMLLLAALSAAAPAAASEARRLEAALDAWDVKTARALLEDGVEGMTRERVQAAWGRLFLLEGDYRRAEEALSKAPAGDRSTAGLLAAARAGRQATRDAARMVTPSGRFSIAYPPGVDEAMLPYLVEALEAQFDALTARLAMVVPVPVRVEVVGTLRGLAADAGIPEEDVRASGVVAAARFNKLVLVSPSQVRWGYPYADTAAHELVHHFLTIRGGDRIPVWFQEAAARYLESLWRGGEAGVLHRGMREILAAAAAQGRLIPLTTLRQSLARIGGMGETALAFAELSSFAAWLEREHGPTVLARLVDALASGDEDKAMVRVTGATLAAASQAWSRELFQAGAPAGRSGAPVKAAEPDREAASAIPPEVVDDVRLGDLLAAEGRHLASASRYRKALAALPEPRTAVVARLATALVDGGENAAAVAALDESRLDEAEYPVLAGARGRALVAMGRAREALSPLLDAARNDPHDPAVHTALEAAFRATGDLEAAERERRLAALWR